MSANILREHAQILGLFPSDCENHFKATSSMWALPDTLQNFVNGHEHNDLQTKSAHIVLQSRSRYCWKVTALQLLGEKSNCYSYFEKLIPWLFSYFTKNIISFQNVYTPINMRLNSVDFRWNIMFSIIVNLALKKEVFHDSICLHVWSFSF